MPFDAALSGLSAALGKLRTSANNIANVETPGFKQSRVETVDASQSGGAVGARIARVATMPSQGIPEITEQAFDLAITGNGYLRLNTNGSLSYTRSGAFRVDRNGYIVNSRGQRLTGYQTDASGAANGTLGDLKINQTSGQAVATSQIDLGLNLDVGANVPTAAFNSADPSTYNYKNTVSIYDGRGSAHQLEIYYRKTSASGQWDVNATIDNNTVLTATNIQFDQSGQLTSGSTITLPSYAPGNGAANIDIKLNLTGSTQFAADNSVNTVSQNGSSSGKLASFTIGNDGTLTARYENGLTNPVGRIALANFNNPQGLVALGNSNYGESFVSGDAIVGVAGSGDFGQLQAGALESSNVNLDEQLVAFKQASYEYMANAKVIKIMDETIGTLIKEKA